MRGSAVLAGAVAGALALPGGAGAQVLLQAQVPVAITVVSGLSVTWQRDVNFGTAVQNAGALTLSAIDAGAGYFWIVAQRNRDVTLTLTPPANLTNGGSTIPYTSAASLNLLTSDPSTATAVVGNTATFRPEEPTGSNSLRRAHLWLHGGVNVGSVPQGLYTGTFTVTVAY
ncbi:MAG TPA: hypothetical protein VMN78_02055 [Longimicrobiales bacterium]|nr:hypothetical protein [Longimicrobiales bacterium]